MSRWLVLGGLGMGMGAAIVWCLGQAVLDSDGPRWEPWDEAYRRQGGPR